jgi:hypothetical protein
MDVLSSIMISTARANEDATFRSAVELALDFYYGRQIKREYFDPSGKMNEALWIRLEPVLACLNITAMIANKLGGGIYEQAPQRVIDKVPPDVAERLMSAWEYDECYTDMDELNAIKTLVGNIYLTPIWDTIAQETKIQSFTPDQVRVVQNAVYPDQADIMAFTWSNVDSGDTKPQVFSKIYSRAGWKVVEGDAVGNSKLIDNRAIKHPETGDPWEGDNLLPGEIPVANFKYRREAGSGSFYGVGLMHELIPANMALNLMLSALRLLSKDQGLSTPVFTNVDDATRATIAIGMINNAIFLRGIADPNGGGTLTPMMQYISPTGDTSQLVRSLESDIGALFARFGLRNQNPLRIDIGNPESGVAKWIGEADVRKEQYRQVPRCRLAEKMLARYWLAVDLENRTGSIPPWLTEWNYDFSINYPNPRKIYDVNETVVMQEWLKSNGCINEIDILMGEDPDIKSRDEAMQLIIDRRIEAKKLETELAKQMPQPAPQAGSFNLLA